MDNHSLGVLGLFITSEILPYIKNYVSTLKTGDINSIFQLVYYTVSTIGTCMYYVGSGKWSEEQKRKKLIKQAEAIEQILSEQIKNDLKKKVEEHIENTKFDTDKDDTHITAQITPEVLEVKQTLSNQIKNLKWGKGAKQDNQL